MQVKIFKSITYNDNWLPLMRELVNRNYTIYTAPEKCDHSIALSGLFENPLALSAKKTLIYHQDEWTPKGSWPFIEPILKEYYDEMIDVTMYSLKETADLICSRMGN